MPSRGTCQINGQAYAAGVRNPNDPSTCCNPDTSPNAWIPRFSDGGVYQFNSNSGPCSGIVAADIYRTGRLDLAVSCGIGTEELVILANQGGGLFQVSVLGPFPIDDRYGSGVLTAADLRKDGTIELIVNASQAIWIFDSRDASPEGGWPQPALFPTSQSGGVPVVGDFDGDGIPDIVLLSGTNGPYPCTQAFFKGESDGGLANALSGDTVECVLDATTASFTGDGKLDVALAGSLLETQLGRGNGTFSPPGVLGTMIPGTDTQGISHADLDGDGNEDLIVGSNDRFLTVFRGYGDGGFASGVDVPVVGAGAGRPTIADLDGDGRLDMSVGDYYEGEIGLVYQLPDGGFTPPVTLPAGQNPTDLVAVDLNGDLTTDIAVVDQKSAVYIYFNACP